MGGRWIRPRAAAVLAAAILVLPTPTAVLSAGPVYGGIPAAPTLIAPIDGAVVGAAPRLTWAGNVNAVYYTVKVWPVGSPENLMCQTPSHGLTADCLDVPPGPYEWTVQSIGNHGHPGGISAIGSFTRSALSLAAPGLVSPANGAVLDYPDAMGRLRWQAVPGAANYQLEVSTSPTFSEGDLPLHYSFPVVSANVPADQLGVLRYWRVRGVNAQRTAAGPWSVTRTFTVTWSEAPTLISPIDGGSASNIVLVWTPVKGATDYDFEITTAGDADFSDATRASPWPASHWAPWGPTPAGDLRWRVRARNGDGGITAWSAARTIHRDANAPVAQEPDPIAPPIITLTGPADGATVPSSDDALLTWAAVAGAVGYQVDARRAGGDWWNAPWTVGAGPLAASFDAGATYGWRVRAIGDGGVLGEWSSERQLSVAPPGPIVIESPPDQGELLASRPIVTWQAANGVGIYWVDICDNPTFAGECVLNQPTEGPSMVLPELAAGRWYLRVRGGTGPTIAQSDVRAFDMVDDVAPTGAIYLAGSPWTAQSTITVEVESDDGQDAPTEVQLSADQATWEAHSLPDFGSANIPWSLTSPDHGGSAPGQRTVYARFRDAAGNWSPIIAASTWYGMENPTDSTPPAGTISIAGGAASTTTRMPLVHVPATDISGVTMISLSTDGVTWVDRPYWPDQQVTLPAGNGLKTVHVKWQDGSGNWSGVSFDTITLGPVGPTATAPTYAFVSGATLRSVLTPTKFSWTGADATSSITHYQAHLSTDGGAYASISTSLPSATLTRSLAAGHTYRLRVRGIDKAGVVGAWVYGATFTVSAYSETSTRIAYSGTWYRPASTAYWAGYERYAKAAGATASFTFTGRAYALIGCVGPTRGSLKVYVNGVLVKTVSTYASTTTCRRVLFSLSWSTAASRTISVVASGTSGHPRVDVDTIVVAY